MSMGAMLDMMQRMMGQSPDGDKAGQKEGEGQGQSAGEGQTGDSSAANTDVDGNPDGKTGDRRVPKSSGSTGSDLPEEFRKALEAYNRPR
ncbi:MAG: hypothetical protein HKN82_09030 [Akkermansiaceae bacterium]|nr:hypothetical protein [Akkermansiaceae bacterium]